MLVWTWVLISMAVWNPVQGLGRSNSHNRWQKQGEVISVRSKGIGRLLIDPRALRNGKDGQVTRGLVDTHI